MTIRLIKTVNKFKFYFNIEVDIGSYYCKVKPMFTESNQNGYIRKDFKFILLEKHIFIDSCNTASIKPHKILISELKIDPYNIKKLKYEFEEYRQLQEKRKIKNDTNI